MTKRKSNALSVKYFAREVAKDTGWRIVDCEKIIRSYNHILGDTVAHGHNISMPGFGSVMFKLYKGYCNPTMKSEDKMVKPRHRALIRLMQSVKQKVADLEVWEIDEFYQRPDIMEQVTIPNDEDDDEYMDSATDGE